MTQGKIKVMNCSKFGEKIKLPQNANKGCNIARILVPDDIQVVQCKKFNETAQMANFTDFSMISCGNGP